MKYPHIDLVKTGDNISRLMGIRKVTVKQLQEYLGFENPQAIYKWKRGDSLPTIDNLVLIAEFLNVTIDKIIVIEK